MFGSGITTIRASTANKNKNALPIPTGNAWTPNSAPFRELVLTAWYQEDLSDGAVSSWAGRHGITIRTAAQANGTYQPTKITANGGVKFNTSSNTNLSYSNETSSVLNIRWWCAVVKANTSGYKNGSATILVINGASGGSAYRQPLLAIGSGAITSQVYDTTFRGVSSLLDKAAPDDWQILVGWRRGRRLYNKVNGQPARFVEYGAMVQQSVEPCYIGQTDNRTTEMWIDSLMYGHGELSDNQIAALEGWAAHRVSRAAALPANHPYKIAPPTENQVEYPDLYNFDANNGWATFDAGSSHVFAQPNFGSVMPPVSANMSLAFVDDFITDTIADDRTRDNLDAIWFAPGWGTTIGIDATIARKSDSPSSYVHDPSGTGSMKFRMVHNGSVWKAPVVHMVDQAARGRPFWTKGRFEVKMRFPALSAPRPGFFPAFWAYSEESFLFRTRNRLETDFLEIDGINGAWINTTQHIHSPTLSGGAGGVSGELNEKPAGRSSNFVLTTTVKNYNVNPGNVAWTAAFGANVDIWDGTWSYYAWTIDDDYFTGEASKDGNTWFKIFSVDTIPEFTQPKYLLFDLALETDGSKGTGVANTALTYDMEVDYVKVWMPESEFAIVPVGFNGRPKIKGSASPGQILECIPNTRGSHLEYRWYRNGVPLVGQNSNKYVIQTTDIGGKIRCQVRNMSIKNRPWAWSLETATIASANFFLKTETNGLIILENDSLLYMENSSYPVNVTLPTIEGTGQVGTYMWATPGTWS
jgi:hypothetical protein